LNIDENVILSELSNSDRNYVVYLINQYYLSLRNSLNIGKDITFGFEIEFEDARRKIIELELLKYFPDKDWRVVDDRSLYNGGEINSPVLRDSEKTWIDLSLVCDIVSNNAVVLDNSSAHIHIGTQILGNNSKYWENFMLLWSCYENIIFRFLYGEYTGARERILEQARPISLELINKSRDIERCAKQVNAYSLFKKINASGSDDYRKLRKRAINFLNIDKLSPYQYNQEIDKNTIEFRSPNGTFDPVIWQNNLNLLIHLFMYCKSDKFDKDKIEYRKKMIIDGNITANINKYSNIYMEQSMELCDMIFNKNIDKIYFLRQYIKSYEVCNRPMVKCRKFTNYENSRIGI